MSKLFDRIIDIDNLRRAFEGIDPRKKPGPDGQTAAHYATKLDTNLATLHDRLSNRIYAMGEIERITMPKPNGGTRDIALVCLEDKIVQRATLAVLAPLIESQFFDWSCARRGLGPVYAAERVLVELALSRPHRVLGVDITNFYGSIDLSLLRGVVERHVVEADLVELVGHFIGSQVLIDGVPTRPSRGIEAGMPISMLLGNLFLHEALDRFVEEELGGARAGITPIRYLDDAVFILTDGVASDELRARVMDRLAEWELLTNPDKTVEIAFGRDEARCLGLKADERAPTGLTFVGMHFTHGLLKTGKWAVWRERRR